MKKLYFLGPKGTYSEQCANKANEILGQEHELVAISTIPKIIEILNSNPFSCAVLPVENSIEGIVRPTIDNLFLTDVKIQAEIDIKIEHCLISKGKKEDIKNILSHPQALAQCSKYITLNFNENINLTEMSSTALSGEMLKEKDETFAAIVSKALAHKLGYNIIDENIGDIKDNITRFVLASKTEMILGQKERTSIVFNTKNESGALLKILEIFKKHNLNLLYLESRPSKKVFGEYNFFADVDSGLSSDNEALREIKQECNFYKYLGSYSRFLN